MSTWTYRPHAHKRNDEQAGAEAAADKQALSFEILCKLISVLDGDFATKVVNAGGMQCLANAMLFGDADQAREAQHALLCLREKISPLPLT